MCKWLAFLILAALIVAIIAGIGSTATKTQVDTSQDFAACIGGIVIVLGVLGTFVVVSHAHATVERENIRRILWKAGYSGKQIEEHLSKTKHTGNK